MVQVMRREQPGLSGRRPQIQPRFSGRAVAFLRVAFPAAANHVFPRGAAAAGARQNMIHRQIPALRAAILTPVLITTHHILLAERRLTPARNIYVFFQPYDGGKMKRHRLAADDQAVRLNGIRLPDEHHANRAAHVANVNRLIRLVEHQNARLLQHPHAPLHANDHETRSDIFASLYVRLVSACQRAIAFSEIAKTG